MPDFAEPLARLITGDVEPLLERGEKSENRDRMLSE